MFRKNQKVYYFPYFPVYPYDAIIIERVKPLKDAYKIKYHPYNDKESKNFNTDCGTENGTLFKTKQDLINKLYDDIESLQRNIKELEED